MCACVRVVAAGIAFPSVVERVMGTRIDIAPVRESLADSTARVRVEAGDAELYGIDGLRMNGVRASGSVKTAFFMASITGIDAPVGSHNQALVEAGYAVPHRWQAAVRVGAQKLSLDGTPALTTHVAGVASRVDVGRVTTVADLEATDVEGPGYETALSLAARVRAGIAQLVGNIEIDGDRFVGAGVSVFARLHSSLALMAGYDDGTESMRAGAVIDWRGIEVAAGVFEHPVLGASQVVSVACFH